MKKVIATIIVLAFAITGIAAISASAAPIKSQAETTSYKPGHSNKIVSVVLTAGPIPGK